MLIKISNEDMRLYETLVDNIHTYRTLLLICDDNETHGFEIDKGSIYRKYQECKEKLTECIYEMESKYNIKLFGNRYHMYPSELQIEIVE